MNKYTKQIFAAGAALVFSAGLFAAPAKTAAQAQALSVVEAFQTTFRSISDTLLPSVVEVDVTEKRTYTDPFQGFSSPFEFFFGRPDPENDRKDNKDNMDNKKREREYEQKGLGSGVIVRRTGNTLYVLTNNHVAGAATKINIKLNDGRSFEAKLVGADERIDVALVSFESDDKTIPVATLGDSSSVMPGDICMAFGAPLGYAQSVTQGIVSATGRSEAHMSSISDYIQTDAAINQGNSGGPLVNIYGEVIGINTWIASQSGGSQGLGFAIPINNIKNSIDAFIKDGKITYGWVGVSLLELTDEYKKQLGVEGIEGAFAAEVYSNAPAFKGGLKPGDYIVELNGKPVKTVNQLVREVGSLQTGSTATFTVIRGGKRLPMINVKVEERLKDVSNLNNKLWPGFIAAPLTDDIKEDLKIDDKKLKGVVVTAVQEKSPAAALRLQNGDVITAVNGKAVKDVSEFYAELANAQKSVNFDVYSNGGTITTGTYKF
ncbi:Do family serine endopeptidase [Treponema sp. C6A8]|uniref:Do family serine endopeptidase n=1 Tax=Treponema sp. C6A8 TaxID=1410609 RepID=UPI000486DFB9|nr:Do family serine endopeptidase [Treponema sp. C6A8]